MIKPISDADYVERLGLSRSAIGKSIIRLEHRLGVRCYAKLAMVRAMH